MKMLVCVLQEKDTAEAEFSKMLLNMCTLKDIETYLDLYELSKKQITYCEPKASKIYINHLSLVLTNTKFEHYMLFKNNISSYEE